MARGSEHVHSVYDRTTLGILTAFEVLEMREGGVAKAQAVRSGFVLGDYLHGDQGQIALQENGL